ncbi:hypothetical protein GYA19_01500 [Candidatus Beckwithbacteria bacterium]|nr:hypothetical protein [Candidatus Beckwithbacteria bacterium]
MNNQKITTQIKHVSIFIVLFFLFNIFLILTDEKILAFSDPINQYIANFSQNCISENGELFFSQGLTQNEYTLECNTLYYPTNGTCEKGVLENNNCVYQNSLTFQNDTNTDITINSLDIFEYNSDIGQNLSNTCQQNNKIWVAGQGCLAPYRLINLETIQNTVDYSSINPLETIQLLPEEEVDIQEDLTSIAQEIPNNYSKAGTSYPGPMIISDEALCALTGGFISEGICFYTTGTPDYPGDDAINNPNLIKQMSIEETCIATDGQFIESQQVCYYENAYYSPYYKNGNRESLTTEASVYTGNASSLAKPYDYSPYNKGTGGNTTSSKGSTTNHQGNASSLAKESQSLNPHSQELNNRIEGLKNNSSGNNSNFSISNLSDPINAKYENLGAVVSAVFKYFLGFTGIILFLLMLFSGFNLLTSAGNQEKIEKGQKTLTSAIIGFIIIFVSFWLMQIIQYIGGLNLGF